MNGPKRYNITDIMLRVEFKFIVSVFLLLFTFSAYTKNPDYTHELCFLAMFFSFCGDIFLMDYQNIPSYMFNGEHFYVGAASFAVAHIIYSQMFRVLSFNDFFWSIGEWFALAILMLLFIFALFAKLRKRSKLFYVVAVIYACIILMNLASAINCALVLGGKYIWALMGVISFVISDFFLLIRETKKDTPLIRKLIWVFYPIAQILIIFNV